MSCVIVFSPHMFVFVFFYVNLFTLFKCLFFFFFFFFFFFYLFFFTALKSREVVVQTAPPVFQRTGRVVPASTEGAAKAARDAPARRPAARRLDTDDKWGRPH